LTQGDPRGSSWVSLGVTHGLPGLTLGPPGVFLCYPEVVLGYQRSTASPFISGSPWVTLRLLGVTSALEVTQGSPGCHAGATLGTPRGVPGNTLESPWVTKGQPGDIQGSPRITKGSPSGHPGVILGHLGVTVSSPRAHPGSPRGHPRLTRGLS
jgi:hypothetical protein